MHPHLGIREHHHQITHSQTQELIALKPFFMARLVYPCAHMSGIQRGGGTLLDSTPIILRSSTLHGTRDSRQVPILLPGGELEPDCAGGALPRAIRRCPGWHGGDAA